MNKYLQILQNYFQDIKNLNDFGAIYSYWKSAPILSSESLLIWIEEGYIEKSDFELSIEYEIEDEYNWRPDHFKVKTKVEIEQTYVDLDQSFKSLPYFQKAEEEFNKLTIEEQEQKIEEIEEELNSLKKRKYLANEIYINTFDGREKLIHDFQSLETILVKKLRYNIVFLVDKENYESYFSDIISSERIEICDDKCFDAMLHRYEYKLGNHYLIEKGHYERELIKIDLKILGVQKQLFEWALNLFPKLVFDSKGTLIKEWNSKHIEGWSSSR